MSDPTTKTGDSEKSPPAVQGGKLVRLSVSQVQTFDASQDGGCPRKWFAEKILGQKRPQTKAQELGTELHAQLEHYIKTGEDTLSPLARAGRHFLPPHDPEHFLSEVPLSFGDKPLVAAGVPFVGYIDLLNVSGRYANSEGEWVDDEPGTVEVVDFKTSRDLEKWAKPSSALIRTVQMPGYGKWAIENFGEHGIDKVRLSHVTWQTEGKKIVKKSTVVVSAEKLHERWQTVEGVVREMKDVAKETDIEKVPANFHACNAFGGCPHRGVVCHPPAEVVLRHALGGKSMSLLNRLREQKKAQQNTDPSPSPTKVESPTEQPAASPAPARRVGLLHRVTPTAAKTSTAPTPPTEPTEPRKIVSGTADYPARWIKASEARAGFHYRVPFSTGPVDCVFVCLTRGGLEFRPLDPKATNASKFTLDPNTRVGVLGTSDATAVLPPDAPPASGVSGPKAEGQKSEDEELAEATREFAEAAGVEAPEHDSPVAEVEDKPKRRRGRPPGSKNKKTLEKEAAQAAATAQAATTAQATVEHDEDVPEQIVTEKQAARVEAATSLRVFIDCYPVKGEAQNLEPHVRQVVEAIRKTYKVADIRLGKPDSDLGYGKWKAILQVALKTADGRPAPGTYYLLARGDEVLEIAAQSIIEVADFAVVGR